LGLFAVRRVGVLFTHFISLSSAILPPWRTAGTEHPPQAGDINNFVKPVQDALCALIYADDSMIRDVSAHMRIADVKCDTEGLPEKLAQAICAGQVCVYVAISDSRELAEEVK
jgi:hypothetical protein